MLYGFFMDKEEEKGIVIFLSILSIALAVLIAIQHSSLNARKYFMQKDQNSEQQTNNN